MLNEKIKSLRKQKGITQEELAIRLNVVRQTVSKWEKGLSVPDADMLIRIADIFEISVSELLGANIENEIGRNEIADQLSRINEQLALKNRRVKLVLKVILGIIIGIIVLDICLVLVGMVSFYSFKNDYTTISSESEIIVPSEQDYEQKLKLE